MYTINQIKENKERTTKYRYLGPTSADLMAKIPILYDDNEPPPTALVNKGRMSKVFKIPSNTLAQGKYRIEFDIGIHMRKKIIDKEGELEFSLQRIKCVGQRFITPAIRGRNSLFRPNAFLNDSD